MLVTVANGNDSVTQSIFTTSLVMHNNQRIQLWPLLLTWFNFNPSMDK